MENQTSVTSEKFSINWKDTLKGLIVSVGTAVVVIIQSSLDAGNLNFNWKQIGMAAIAALVTYLVKNFFTSASIQTKVENKTVSESDLPTISK